VAARHALRAVAPDRREAGARALRTLFGREAPPFGAPPGTSVDRSTL
jgi:hypothetical protein